MPKTAHQHTPRFYPHASFSGIGRTGSDDRLDQKDLDMTTRRLVGREPGRDHAGVVQNDEGSTAKEARQFAKKAVIALAVIFAKNEQPRRIPLPCRMCRDQPFGQLIVKIVCKQELSTPASQHAFCQHKIKPS
jgi:hypothetical protein